MINNNGLYEIDLNDQIMMNQFIRNGIDFPSFDKWYCQLSDEEKSVLVSALVEFAYQAGLSEAIMSDAFIKSGVLKEDKLIKELLDFNLDMDSIEEWYYQLIPSEKIKVFKFSVYLFGLAENNVFFNVCSVNEDCNHWWHRDILNNDVVESIINNAEYYLTSKKDDV